MKQIVYIPIKRKDDLNRNIIDNLKSTKFIYSKTFNDFDRIFYKIKVNKILGDINKKIELGSINLIHAYFLFSMGGIAQKIMRERGINYIVNIQNTDVNIFFKYGFFLRKKGVEIMKGASKIIFISPEYKKYVINRYIPYKLRDYINQKSVIIPMGINPFWLQNKYINKPKFKIKNKINLIYVGEFTKNKNIPISIKVARKLKDIGYNVNFTIVGGGGNNESKVKRLAKANEDVIKIHDRIQDRAKLLNIYRKSNIFIMPSLYETFGLVYIEAMSQGLPLIYTRGQGIDGYFKEGTVGYSVDPDDINDIINKIEMILNNYDNISKNCYDLVENFSWEKIAQAYYKIYISSS
jgi:glycosyltransferase involved in cell wall biosynthesis